MNKKLLEKATKLSISPERLLDNRELYPVEWLLKKVEPCIGYTSKLEMIKDMILEMDKWHPNYHCSTDEDKVKIEKLIQSEEVVDIVLVTLFQWFGTNVGKSDIGTLLDEIRELKHSEIRELKHRYDYYYWLRRWGMYMSSKTVFTRIKVNRVTGDEYYYNDVIKRGL